MIRLHDNNEPLVDVRMYCPSVKIALDKERLKKEKTAFVRRSVAKKLQKAQKLLPTGMYFVVRDAWRPAYVQAKIFFWFLERGAKLFPKFTKAQIKHAIENTYVAPWKGKKASGHMTGGALDIRVIDARGRKIPMVTKKLSYTENAAPEHPKLPAYLKRNRMILRIAMAGAGFSNHHAEYWHWSYGDYYWAKRGKKKKTLYLPIADPHGMYKNEPCPCGSGKKFLQCHGR